MNAKVLLTLVLVVGSAIAAPSYKGVKQGRTIKDLLDDLIKESGINDLMPWLQEQIKYDPHVQGIVEYLQGPQFQKIIDHLKGCPGYQETKDDLLAEGIDLADLLEKFRDFFIGKKSWGIKPRRTLGDILLEFLDKFDMTHIRDVIKDKKQNDPEMKKLIHFLNGDTFNGIVDCMKESPELQELVQKLEDEGVYVEQMVDTLESMFDDIRYHMSYKPHGRKISDLLEDLINEFGLKELIPWLQDQIKNDPDVQRIVEYLQGPQFQKIIDHLKGCPGYQETKDQLLAEGIDLADLFQKFRDFLSGKNPWGIKPRRTLGELLDEFLGKLDMAHIIEVIKDKIANDPDMKKVIDFLKGDTFKGIVDCMKQSPEVQELVQKLKDEGVDVERIIEMIKALLGGSKYHMSYKPHGRKIIDLINELFEEFGIKALLPWVEEQIRNDPDVQRIVKYLQGPQFDKIIEHLKSCPGYQETKEALLAEGVDLVQLYKDFRDFLSGALPTGRRTLGEILNEFLGKLDLAHIIEVIRDKYQNDHDMKKIVEWLKSDTFKGIGECMRQSPEVQELVQKLLDEGIDVERMHQMIRPSLNLFLSSLNTKQNQSMDHSMIA